MTSPKEAMKPTPRTDAAIRDLGYRYEFGMWIQQHAIDVDFARTLEEECALLQARIDSLMLEYCPDEMTPEQRANWEANQRAATPEQARAIDLSSGIVRNG